MVVEDLDDLGLLDAGTLCARSAWSTSSTRRGAGLTRSDRVDEPDRPAAAIERDRRAVVDGLDLLGDVRDEVVERDRQRVALDERVHGLRQRDHPARHVGVQRRRDDRRPGLGRQARGSPSVGRTPFDSTSSETPVSIARRCERSRSPTTTTSPRSTLLCDLGVHRLHPHPPLHLLLGRAALERPLEHGDDRCDRRRRVQPRRLARLADVAPRQCPLGEHAGQHAVVVDDRHDVLRRHEQADRPHRVAPVGDREALAHDVADAQLRVRQEDRQRRAGALEQPRRLGVAAPSRTGL